MEQSIANNESCKSKLKELYLYIEEEPTKYGASIIAEKYDVLRINFEEGSVHNLYTGHRIINAHSDTVQKITERCKQLLITQDCAILKSTIADYNDFVTTSIETDSVKHPRHYCSHPSGVECIQITEYYDFCIGNAIKYLWRNGLKKEQGLSDKEKQIEDLEKAIWYINREIENLKK